MSRSGDGRKFGMASLLKFDPSPPRKLGSRASDGSLGLWIPAFAGMTEVLIPGFHRQAVVVRPFRHRGVVEPYIGVAEHDEGQRIGARRDAAAAIGDDPGLVEGADRLEFGAERGRRQKDAGRRIY